MESLKVRSSFSDLFYDSVMRFDSVRGSGESLVDFVISLRAEMKLLGLSCGEIRRATAVLFMLANEGDCSRFEKRALYQMVVSVRGAALSYETAEYFGEVSAVRSSVRDFYDVLSDEDFGSRLFLYRLVE